MRTRIFVLAVIFLAVMAVYGYLTPTIKALFTGCNSVEDQMQYNIESKNCEE